MSEWIRISDERSPYMETVIFYDGDNVWPGWDEGNVSLGEDLCWVCCDPAFSNRNEVTLLCGAKTPTHWMLLPEGPRSITHTYEQKCVIEQIQSCIGEIGRKYQGRPELWIHCLEVFLRKARERKSVTPNHH